MGQLYFSHLKVNKKSNVEIGNNSFYDPNSKKYRKLKSEGGTFFIPEF